MVYISSKSVLQRPVTRKSADMTITASGLQQALAASTKAAYVGDDDEWSLRIAKNSETIRAMMSAPSTPSPSQGATATQIAGQIRWNRSLCITSNMEATRDTGR
jgi:hypothetical protein